MTDLAEIETPPRIDEIESVTIPIPLYAAFIRATLFARELLEMSSHHDALASQTMFSMATRHGVVTTVEIPDAELDAMDDPPPADARPIERIEFATDFRDAVQFLDEAHDEARKLNGDGTEDEA